MVKIAFFVAAAALCFETTSAIREIGFGACFGDRIANGKYFAIFDGSSPTCFADAGTKKNMNLNGSGGFSSGNNAGYITYTWNKHTYTYHFKKKEILNLDLGKVKELHIN